MSGLSFLTFEFYDGTTRPDGMVFSTKLPVTQGQWKGAKIPFDSLKLPDWPEKVALLNDTQKKFDVKKLDKIQIRFQGINEIGATFSLDNVYWYLDAPCPGVTYKATQENKMAVTSKLTVKNLTVSLNSLPQGVHTGFAEIIGTDGRIFAEKKITASGTSSFSIRTGHLSPGVYMLRVNTVNGNGLKTSFNDKVTIVQR